MRDVSPIVKPNGLFIPEPIVVAFFNMDYAEIGRSVRHMIEWTHHLSICDHTLETMGDQASYTTDIWKTMIKQEYEGSIILTKDIADGGDTDDN